MATSTLRVIQDRLERLFSTVMALRICPLQLRDHQSYVMRPDLYMRQIVAPPPPGIISPAQRTAAIMVGMSSSTEHDTGLEILLLGKRRAAIVFRGGCDNLPHLHAQVRALAFIAIWVNDQIP